MNNRINRIILRRLIREAIVKEYDLDKTIQYLLLHKPELVENETTLSIRAVMDDE